ncbi:MAG: methionyl-tRNA formyltransferase [bacterium]|nr:methionyl-tRNA formyltransferase [bacterium]
MRVVFIGTDELGEIALRKIAESSHDIVLVVTQPDRPKGRCRKLIPGLVKLVAGEYKIPCIQPETIKDEVAKGIILEAEPEIIVIVSYGEYVPSSIYNAPKYKSINLHPSLLPRWRGASPVRYALLAGDQKTGVTVQYVHKKIDAGDILRQEEVKIDPDDDHGTLCQKLYPVGAELLIDVLDDFELNGPEVDAERQDESKVTKAPKIEKEDILIDWAKTAFEVRNLIRAFCPKPGAKCIFRGENYKILSVDTNFTQLNGNFEPGEIFTISENGPVVACSDKGICLTNVQPPGKNPISSRDFLNGYRVEVGEKFLKLNLD